jgi:hypothetical protein
MPLPLLGFLAGALAGKATEKKVAVSKYTTKKGTKVKATTRKAR